MGSQESDLMMSIFNTKTLAIAFVSASLVVPAYAQAPAIPAAPTNWISTAPFMKLKLNMATVSTAIEGDIVSPGQPIVSYLVTPRSGVKTLAASAARISTYPPSVPANTILFEVGLNEGNGYCAPIQPDQGVRESQCFIDVNADNKFDATYIGNDTWKGKTIYWGQVAKLASIPPVAYETAAVTGIPSEPMSFYFKRVRNQMAEFQMSLGPRNNGVPVRKCAIDGVTTCRLGRHIFVFEAAGAGIKVKSSTMAGDQMDITTSG
jgi:hypothetical protein